VVWRGFLTSSANDFSAEEVKYDGQIEPAEFGRPPVLVYRKPRDTHTTGLTTLRSDLLVDCGERLGAVTLLGGQQSSNQAGQV
jgi:hypothetical protein